MAEMFTHLSRYANLPRLHTELEKIFQHDLKHYNYNRNHVALTTAALHFLGGLGEKCVVPATTCMLWYYDVALPKFEKMHTPSFGESIDASLEVRCTDDLWSKCVGNRAAISAAARFLQQDYEKHVTDSPTRRQWLVNYLAHDKVRWSIASAAFHGLVRLAYGLDMDYAGDIIFGVATIITNAIETPRPHVDRRCSVVDVSDSHQAALDTKEVREFAIHKNEKKQEASGLHARCAAMFEVPEFAKVLPRLDGDQPDRVLHNLIEFGLSQFEEYHDFSALTIFNATIALHTLLQEIRVDISAHDLSDLLTGFWAEVLALSVMLRKLTKKQSTSKDPRLTKPRALPELDEEDGSGLRGLPQTVYVVLEVAARDAKKMLKHNISAFEHLIKLAYAMINVVYKAREMARTYPDQPTHARWANLLESRCIKLLRREAAVFSPVM